MSRAPFVMGKADGRPFRAIGRDLRHHHRLALHQPADEGAVRRRFDAGDGRERRRGVSRCRARIRTPLRVRSQHKAAARTVALRLVWPRRSPRWTVPRRQGPARSLSSKDEHPRADTTVEALAKLKAVRAPAGGTVTAGNASGVNDGAAAHDRRLRRGRGEVRPHRRAPASSASLPPASRRGSWASARSPAT